MGATAWCDLSSVDGVGAAPALSGKARRALEALLGDRVEWLPLAFADREFALLNVTHLPSVLDRKNCGISHFQSGRLKKIEAYAFDAEHVRGHPILKVTDWSYHVLVSEEFQRAVRDAGLTGFSFTPVWDSEIPPFKWWPAVADIPLRRDVYGPGGLFPHLREYWPDDWSGT